jgi:hypothetical protein
MRVRRDLDAWARCLGAANDDDAGTAVVSLLDLLEDAMQALRRVRGVVEGSPDSQDTGARLRRAGCEVVMASADLSVVLESFDQHERGRRR